ncbi:hypothetical protein [Paenibacillus crassostreae]|uniref:hypothetical protein n=1 Tax=Paenibacillus crassostreae TaxID=1763538 RepID=UPI000A52BCD2|nr:hypothetical protein [Paenibacillus crassostreae]
MFYVADRNHDFITLRFTSSTFQNPFRIIEEGKLLYAYVEEVEEMIEISRP